MKDVALITLHGMGKVKPNYYSKLEDALKKRLGDDWARVSFNNVQYAPILQEPEDKLWRAIISDSENDIDAVRLRKFFMFGFGDAGSLEHSAHGNGVKYQAVQTEIQRALKDALLDFEGDHTKPVVIVAQSLGCQVISNYLWDAEKNKQIFSNSNTGSLPADELSFLKLKSLKHLVTTGCNIPLFIAGLDQRTCFTPPDGFSWDNFYDPDDPLGWPLQQLDSTYGFIRDHHINAGGLLTSWNPMSHGGYWSDDDVLRPLTNILMNCLA